LLTGFIKITFAGKDQQKTLALKGVFYRGLTKKQGFRDIYFINYLSLEAILTN